MSVRVLLADDHAIMREGLRVLLSRATGIDVVAEAGNGHEAVQQALALRPDVVVLDIAMPGLNGIEAAAMIRSKCATIRLIMLSMHATSEHVYRAFAAGASGYLLKEAAAHEVVTAIRAVVGGRQYLSTGLGMAPADLQDTMARSLSPIERLSARERQVLQLVVEGHSSSAIAGIVHLSPKSVDTYRSRIMKKLAVEDLASLVRFAVQHGLTPNR
ncbi:MAG: DNA-binding response regulator [Gammaproteobacteria bacterium HGW-Gammaproteobacteria-4]|jgi:DNA-binding NarL/FixJ family response regulator|nr:MAG: DNA-binding response regulator [Gammaproteobacteria bacterium HGW-Gammaproteobacteria-4]